jgi:hypothetical protein
MSRHVLLVVVALGAAACASSPSRMHRALDPSMERVLRTEQYLFNVSGISSVPSRLARGDGFIYMSDLAPQMRFFANTGDTARYRVLRAFVQDHMVRRDPDGLVPARMYRANASFQQATPYSYLFLGRALREAWLNLGDTASAQLVGQIKWNEMPSTANYSTMYKVMTRCAEAMDVVATDPATGRAVLKDAKALMINTPKVKVEAEQAALGATAAKEEMDALSCLIRLSIALSDPDATVRNLDHLLDHLQPLVSHSGRPDPGTTADILLTLNRVRSAGPRYFEPVTTAKE